MVYLNLAQNTLHFSFLQGFYMHHSFPTYLFLLVCVGLCAGQELIPGEDSLLAPREGQDTGMPMQQVAGGHAGP